MSMWLPFREKSAAVDTDLPTEKVKNKHGAKLAIAIRLLVLATAIPPTLVVSYAVTHPAAIQILIDKIERGGYSITDFVEDVFEVAESNINSIASELQVSATETESAKSLLTEIPEIPGGERFQENFESVRFFQDESGTAFFGLLEITHTAHIVSTIFTTEGLPENQVQAVGGALDLAAMAQSANTSSLSLLPMPQRYELDDAPSSVCRMFCAIRTGDELQSVGLQTDINGNRGGIILTDEGINVFPPEQFVQTVQNNQETISGALEFAYVIDALNQQEINDVTTEVTPSGKILGQSQQYTSLYVSFVYPNETQRTFVFTTTTPVEPNGLPNPDSFRAYTLAELLPMVAQLAEQEGAVQALTGIPDPGVLSSVITPETTLLPSPAISADFLPYINPDGFGIDEDYPETGAPIISNRAPLYLSIDNDQEHYVSISQTEYPDIALTSYR